MKKKILIFLIAIVVLGLTAGAYAIKLNSNANAAKTEHCNMDCCKNHDGSTTASTETKDSCCGMENCCKDGHCSMDGDCCKNCCEGNDNCPMKNKQSASNEPAADMSNVVVAGSEDNCCQPGADCCNGGSCCKKG
jgi:hypothetical protein